MGISNWSCQISVAFLFILVIHIFTLIQRTLYFLTWNSYLCIMPMCCVNFFPELDSPELSRISLKIIFYYHGKTVIVVM